MPESKKTNPVYFPVHFIGLARKMREDRRQALLSGQAHQSTHFYENYPERHRKDLSGDPNT